MRTLIALTTYGAAAYVDLSLTAMQRYNADIIVCDDGSCSMALQEVCCKHRVPLIGCCRTRERVPGFGDMIGTVEALEYAASHGFDLVIKQSRRWITLADPRPSLEMLAFESAGNTFSNVTHSFNFGFRTEFTGYLVRDWLKNLPKIYSQIKSGREVFVEGFIHKLAREIEPETSRYREYIKREKNFRHDQTGYVHWEFMGEDRKQVPAHIMWHDTHTPQEYYRKACALGLIWKLADFEDFNK